MLGLATAGWYSIPKARLYDALGTQSGAAMAFGSIAGLIGGVFPLLVGVAASSFGLGTAMWLLLAAPVALLVGLHRAPRGASAAGGPRERTLVSPLEATSSSAVPRSSSGSGIGEPSLLRSGRRREGVPYPCFP